MKQCKKFHYYIFKGWGMLCGICDNKIIWEEKLKQCPKDLTQEQWIKGIRSKIMKMPE